MNMNNQQQQISDIRENLQLVLNENIQLAAQIDYSQFGPLIENIQQPGLFFLSRQAGPAFQRSKSPWPIRTPG
jgi:hypothetical protein